MTASKSACAALIELNERLFLDDGSKDVTFELRGGTQERAHRCVLQAKSEVFAAMFKHGMREGSDRVVSLPDVDRQAMRIFLRLLYTQQLDPSDWGSSFDELHEEPRIWKQEYMSVEGSKFTAIEKPADKRSYATIDCEEPFVISFEFVEPTCGRQCMAMILQDLHSEVKQIASVTLAGALSSLELHTAADQSTRTALPAFRDLKKVTLEYSQGHVDLTVNGAKLDLHIPEFEYAGLLTCKFTMSKGASTMVTVRSGRPCPTRHLLCAASLAGKYMLPCIQASALATVAQRLRLAKSNDNVRIFVDTMMEVIAADVFSLRVTCLDLARDFKELRERFDAGSLDPGVMSELEAIWPKMSLRDAQPLQFKRRRMG